MKVNANEIALVCTIEGNKNSINNQYGSFKHKRSYEDEAIKCFTHWRKNAGWLKDITIIAHCPTKNTISEDTKKQLEELNVRYIEEYREETDSYKNGFLNVFLSGRMLEHDEEVKEEIFIHIDLDMTIIKELPEHLFKHPNKIVCGAYDKSSILDQRENFGTEIFDTGFIISHKSSIFYTMFSNLINAFIENGYDEEYRQIQESRKDLPLNDYDVEEYFFDKLYRSKLIEVIAFKNYQLGEGYPSINEYDDEELKNIYFWHEHLFYDKKEYNGIKERIEFKKRLNNEKK